jgi:hypothetical protein
MPGLFEANTVYAAGLVIAGGDEYLPYTGLVIALINSFNLFWIACTWAWVGGLEMVWLNTVTLGFSAVAEIRLAVLVAFESMMDFKPVNWFRNSDEEMRELFTGNDGSNGISLR